MFLRQARAYAKNDTYRHTMFSQIETAQFIAGFLQHHSGNYGYRLTLLQALSS